MRRNRLTAVLAVAVGTLGLPAAAQASYSTDVLASNPLTYLRLGETPASTVAEDSSPNNRDGIYAGSPSFGVPGPFAGAGSAVRLAAGDTITAPVDATSGSVELWVNPNRLAKNQQAGIVSHGDPAGDGWALGIGAKRKLAFVSDDITVGSKVTLSASVWTALTVTWDGTRVRIYRNGALAKTLTNAVARASGPGDLVVGADGDGHFKGRYSGVVDEVAVYQQVLTAADIRAHMTATQAPVNTSLPTIAGKPEVGQELTVTPGTWTNGAAATYQWQRCDSEGADCVDIGATGSRYVLTLADKCSVVQVVETVRNATNQTAAVASNRVGPVAPCGDPQPAPENDQLPVILDDGTPAVDETLTVRPGIWSFAVASASYQWQRCDSEGLGCTDIAGKTENTYTAAPGDACKTLRVIETMSNAGGTDSAVSEPTKVVGPCGDTGGGTGTGTGPGTSTGTGTTGGPGVHPAACLKLLPDRKQVKVRGLGTLRLKAAAGACVTKALPALFKAGKGVKVKFVRYKLDGKRLAGVKRPRFGARLKPSKLRAGKHTLTVRVTPRAGKAKAAKLRVRVVVS